MKYLTVEQVRELLKVMEKSLPFVPLKRRPTVAYTALEGRGSHYSRAFRI